MEDEKLFTVQEAAKMLDVGDTAIRNAIRDGRLPFEFLYGRKLIKASDLEVYKQRAHPDGEKPRGRPRTRKETKQ